MRIPKKLKVGGMEYKVIQGYIFKEVDLMGQAAHNQNEIRLADKEPHNSQTYNIQKKEECFIHEMLHAIDCVYNNNATDEKTVDRLSQGIYQVLKDNKLF